MDRWKYCVNMFCLGLLVGGIIDAILFLVQVI